jgi:hypothetical protein
MSETPYVSNAVMNGNQQSTRGADYAALAAFVAVARERSFRRAAARLGLTPSSLIPCVSLSSGSV